MLQEGLFQRNVKAVAELLCFWYNQPMEKVVRIFRSFEESEHAETEYCHSLTPEQRMKILFELIAVDHHDETTKGFERVYRIVKLGKG